MEAGLEHRHNGDKVSDEFLFRRERVTIDNHQFGMVPLTEGFEVVIPEAN